MHYTSENGLPQNSIQDVSFDRHRYLWIATEGGLCRFDGSNFFTYNANNAPVLEGSRFRNFLRDGQGDLHVAEGDYNFYRIDDRLDVSMDTIYPRSRFLIMQDQKVFVVKNLVHNRLWQRLFPRGPAWPYKSIYVNQEECYRRGIDNKLYYINEPRNIVSKMVLPPGLDDPDRSLVLDGGLLVMFDGTRYRCFKGDRLQTGLVLSTDAARFLRWSLTARPSTVLAPPLGMGAFGMKDRSFYRFVLKGMEISLVPLYINLPVDRNDITFAKIDSVSGCIFIGTYTNGLYILRPAPIFAMPLMSSREASNSTYDIVPMPDGGFMTNLQQFDIRTGKAKLLGAPLRQTTLFRDNSARLFFMKGGAMFLSRDNMASQKLIVKDIEWDCSYCGMGNGTVFIGYNHMLGKVDGKDNFVPLLSMGKSIAYIFRYSRDILWLMTTDGLYKYDIRTNSVGPGPLFPYSHTRSIYRARDGSIWLGTYGNGLYAYRHGKFKKIPMDNLSSLKNTHNFYEDEKGFFWMTTNNGLVQCLKADLDAYLRDTTLLPYYYHYNHNDGLLTDEFNGSGQSPYAMDREGTLVYPCIRGIAYFDPLKMENTIGLATPGIESVFLDGKKAGPESKKRIPPDFDNLTINIGCPYYGNPENLILDYRVEGLGTAWTGLGTARAITFNRLPSGDYRFVVRKRNGFGPNNFVYTEVRFTVLPFYYQTWWFYTLIVLVLALATGAFIYMKNRTLINRKRVLEGQVRSRTAQLDDSIDKLNKKIGELYVSDQMLSEANDLKEKAIAIILHDVKAPINFMNMAANGFSANVDRLSRDEIREYSVSFSQTLQETDRFVEELLQWLLIQKETFRPEYSPFDLNELMLEIKMLYRNAATWQGDTIEIGADASPFPIYSDRKILKLIIRNLVDNAIKNTRNGRVLMSAIRVHSTEGLEITITDNGPGINRLQLDILTKDTPGSIELKGKGVGFELIKTFLKQLGGGFRINSEPGKGTAVILSLPGYKR